jgi:hypothetical protein
MPQGMIPFATNAGRIRHPRKGALVIQPSVSPKANSTVQQAWWNSALVPLSMTVAGALMGCNAGAGRAPAPIALEASPIAITPALTPKPVTTPVPTTPTRLHELLIDCASSIDFPGSRDQVRINGEEAHAIFEMLPQSAPDDLAATLKLLEPAACLPTYRTSMWQDKNEAFRLQLRAVIEQRLADPSTPVPQIQDSEPVSQHPRAVLLIDTEYGNTSPELWHERVCMAKVLERANAAGVPVFEIVLPMYETDPQFARLRNPKNWVRLEKRTTSAIPSTNIEQELMRRGTQELIVMGLNEDACVWGTVDDATKCGFKVVTSPLVVQNGWDAGSKDLSSQYHKRPDITVVRTLDELLLYVDDDSETLTSEDAPPF